MISFCLFHVHAVDLVPANLPKLLNILVDASPEWMDLGLQLGVDQTTLRVIERDYRDMTKRCFMEMLSEWLKMIDPLPSWEELIAALKLPSVGHKDLAKIVEAKIGMAVVHGEERNGEVKPYTGSFPLYSNYNLFPPSRSSSGEDTAGND